MRCGIEHYPPERNRLPAHLTLFHQLPPSAADELKQRLSFETRGIRAPKTRAPGLMPLGRGVALRIESPELAAIRERLAGAFSQLLTMQDAGRWRPHVTIQNKVAPVLAKALIAALSRDLRPREVGDRRAGELVVSRRRVGAAFAPHVRLTGLRGALMSPRSLADPGDIPIGVFATMRTPWGGVAQLVRARES
ncbi:MAG: 2'-5' RNA ligase family protein [Sphingomonas sp.]